MTSPARGGLLNTDRHIIFAEKETDMKSISAALAILCLCVSTAIAANGLSAPDLPPPLPPGVPSDLQDENILPTAKDEERTTDAIVNDLMKTQGWCMASIPQPEKGEITIFYRRDKSGRCTAHVLLGK